MAASVNVGFRRVRIAVVDLRSLVLQELDELEARALAVVVDVGLVGERPRTRILDPRTPSRRR
jgi:hypothetical protein